MFKDYELESFMREASNAKPHWFAPALRRVCDSHIEANAMIKFLEDKLNERTANNPH